MQWVLWLSLQQCLDLAYDGLCLGFVELKVIVHSHRKTTLGYFIAYKEVDMRFEVYREGNIAIDDR
jgi:hypothetical protein